jgi:hypothetical protein
MWSSVAAAFASQAGLRKPSAVGEPRVFEDGLERGAFLGDQHAEPHLAGVWQEARGAG